MSYQQRLLLWYMRIAVIEFESSAHGWLQCLKGTDMNQESKASEQEMLDEYDFSGGVRGKYVGRVSQGSNVVVLDPDVARVFTNSESVNQALRALVAIIDSQAAKAERR
jgi:hypothetical protein